MISLVELDLYEMREMPAINTADKFAPAFQLTYSKAQELLKVVNTTIVDLINKQAYYLHEGQTFGLSVETGKSIGLITPTGTGGSNIGLGPTISASTPTTGHSQTIQTPEIISDAQTGTLVAKLVKANENIRTSSQVMDETNSYISFGTNWFSIPKLPVSDPTITDNPLDAGLQVTQTQLTAPALEHQKSVMRLEYRYKLSLDHEEDVRNQLALINQQLQQAYALQAQLNQMYGNAAGTCQITLVNDSAEVAAGQQAAANSFTANTTPPVNQPPYTNPFPDSTWPQIGNNTTSLFTVKFPNYSNIFIPKLQYHGDKATNSQNSIQISQRWFLASLLNSGTLVTFPTVIKGVAKNKLVVAPVNELRAANVNYYFKNNVYVSPTMAKAFITFAAYMQKNYPNLILRVSEAFPPTSRHLSTIAFLNEDPTTGTYRYNGGHWTGNAMDVVLELLHQKYATSDNISAILKDTFHTTIDQIIHDAQVPNKLFSYAGDEYHQKTTHTTGPHIHLQLNTNPKTWTNAPTDAHENLQVYAVLPASLQTQLAGWKQTKYKNNAQALLSGTDVSLELVFSRLGIIPSNFA